MLLLKKINEICIRFWKWESKVFCMNESLHVLYSEDSRFGKKLQGNFNFKSNVDNRIAEFYYVCVFTSSTTPRSEITASG